MQLCTSCWRSPAKRLRQVDDMRADLNRKLIPNEEADREAAGRGPPPGLRFNQPAGEWNRRAHAYPTKTNKPRAQGRNASTPTQTSHEVAPTLAQALWRARSSWDEQRSDGCLLSCAQRPPKEGSEMDGKAERRKTLDTSRTSACVHS